MKPLPFIFFAAAVWTIPSSAQTFPVPEQTVIPYDCQACEYLSHANLNSSWQVEDEALTQENLPKQKSQQYQIQVTGEQLKKGVAIYTQAKAPIIRIRTGKSDSATNYNFFIQNNQGKQFTLVDAAFIYSKKEALKNTPFADQLLALQLKPEMGFGKFIIQNKDQALNDKEIYIIHVLDKNSPIYLNIETDKAHYYYGDNLKVSIQLNNKELTYPLQSINAKLIHPDGEITQLNLEPTSDNYYQAQIDLNWNKNGLGENWYIKIEASALINEETVLRDAHTAFSYVIPSATIKKIKMQENKPFSFLAKVKVATGSRYALEAVLFGSDDFGKLHPISAVQSGSWLGPGEKSIHFSFDNRLKTHYKPPYYLGYLHLIDFGQLKPVYEYNEPIKLEQLRQKV